MVTDRRQRKLGQARADLTELPNMIDTLDTQVLETGGAAGGSGKLTGSPALVRTDILAIVDPSRKPGWYGEDPRHMRLGERYGAVATLEAWVRVVFEELPEIPELAEHATVRSEASVLLEHWPWIDNQDWAEYLAEDVINLSNRCRAALGIRTEYRPRCRYCRSIVHPVEAGTHMITTWEACAYGLCGGCKATYPPGPALAALAAVQAPLPLSGIAAQIGIPLRTLQRWANAGAIKPAPNGAGKRIGCLFDLAEVRETAARLNRTVSA